MPNISFRYCVHCCSRNRNIWSDTISRRCTENNCCNEAQRGRAFSDIIDKDCHHPPSTSWGLVKVKAPLNTLGFLSACPKNVWGGGNQQVLLPPPASWNAYYYSRPWSHWNLCKSLARCQLQTLQYPESPKWDTCLPTCAQMWVTWPPRDHGAPKLHILCKHGFWSAAQDFGGSSFFSVWNRAISWHPK